MRQIMNSVSPQVGINNINNHNTSIQTSQLLSSSSLEPSSIEQHMVSDVMIKSLQTMKNIMVHRYKLDPTRYSSFPSISVTSSSDYHELLALADYIEWLASYLKTNLIFDNSSC